MIGKRWVMAGLVAAFGLVSVPVRAAEGEASAKAKYVFLLIGDGMGNEQCRAAEMSLRAAGNRQGLNMRQLPGIGWAKTASLSGVTDSAAAGTALACGVKTKNGYLGLDGEGKRAESVAKAAKREGFKVGILTNVPINHATPAAFYAHAESRSSYSPITAFIPESGFDLLAGEDFLVSKDETNPHDMLRKAGYTILNDAAAFLSLDALAGKTVFTLRVANRIERKQEEKPTQAQLLSQAIRLLDSDAGFFIMLEGGRIDWACHNNDLGASIGETLDFDDAVGVALDFYRARPTETLLVVTADHETGKLSVPANPTTEQDAATLRQAFSKSRLPKIADQCKKDKLPYEETVTRLAPYGLGVLSEAENAQLKKAYDDFLSFDAKDTRPPEIQQMYGDRNPVALVCARILDARCGASWGTFGHSDTDVPVLSAGSGSERLTGVVDNTLVPQVIREAMGLAAVTPAAVAADGAGTAAP